MCDLSRVAYDIGPGTPARPCKGGRSKLLTREEELDLLMRAQDGDAAARTALVKAYVPFIESRVRKFAQLKSRLDSTLYDDLRQEGFIGLLKAIDKFDVMSGHRFLTYAKWWVFATIIAARHKVAIVTTANTGKQRDAQRKLVTMLSALAQELGRDPTRDELATALQISEEQLIALMGERGMHGGRHRAVEDTDLIETYTPERLVLLKQEQDYYAAALADALDVLTERERDVLRARYQRDEPLTLAELGKKYSLSRERIRQIEEKALERVADHKRRVRARQAHKKTG